MVACGTEKHGLLGPNGLEVAVTPGAAVLFGATGLALKVGMQREAAIAHGGLSGHSFL
jgi:hypothetical protein